MAGALSNLKFFSERHQNFQLLKNVNLVFQKKKSKIWDQKFFANFFSAVRIFF